MLKYRLISAVILLLIIITILFFLPPTWFIIFMLIICILAAWEWGQFSSFMSSYLWRIWLTILHGLLLIITLFLILDYHLNIHQLLITSALLLSLGWWAIALLLVIFYPSSAVIWRNSKILHFIFGLLTIIPFFCGTIMLRNYHYGKNYHNGSIWLLYIILLAWGSDSGGYVFGKLLGKHKLIPKISPKKTWQGFIGGLFTSIIISYSYGIRVNIKITPSVLLTCSILTALASVLGDLTESMFKREAGIKDSGHIIPGHGGILDCIDSLTAAVPIFTCLLLLIFKII